VIGYQSGQVTVPSEVVLPPGRDTVPRQSSGISSSPTTVLIDFPPPVTLSDISVRNVLVMATARQNQSLVPPVAIARPVTLEVEVTRTKGDVWVGVCPELTLATEADDLETLVARVQKAVEGYFNFLNAHGTELNHELEAHLGLLRSGWSLRFEIKNARRVRRLGRAVVA